jgi:hypothetical protein
MEVGQDEVLVVQGLKCVNFDTEAQPGKRIGPGSDNGVDCIIGWNWDIE